MRRLAVIVLAGCAGHQTPAALASTLQVLDGELAITAPAGASVRPNEPEDLMAARPASANETVVKWNEGGAPRALKFRRELEPCAADPAAAARKFAAELDGGAFDLAAVTPTTFLYLPKLPGQANGVTSAGVIVTCAGAAGMISANMVFKGGELVRARGVMRAIAASFATGAHPSVPGPRELAIAACGRKLTVALPAGYYASEDVGDDFSVHRFSRVGGTASFGIYVGHSPHAFAAADAPRVELAGGGSAQRWQDDAGIHVERITGDGGCVIQGFGVGAAADETELLALVGFAIG